MSLSLKPVCLALSLCHRPLDGSPPALLVYSTIGGLLIALTTYAVVDVFLNRRKYRIKEERRRRAAQCRGRA